MKKILIALIACMFIISMLPGIIGEKEADETFKERKFVDNRDKVPMYTAQGLIVEDFSAKGKPGGVGGGKNKAPSVTITNPLNGATVSGMVTITVTVNDKEDDPDPTPTIYINEEYKATAFSYDWNTDSEPDGNYEITASATDSGGKTGSDSITVTKGEGNYGPVDKYALVIGISDYEGSGSDLTYCDDDAMDWKAFLQGEGYTVSILTNAQATGAGIDAAVDDLLADEDGNDYVVMTYSGHGTKYMNYGSSLVSYDFYAMTHGWLEAKFDSSDSPHVYFAFDACEIGDFRGLIDSNKVGAFASNRRLSYDGDSSMKNGVFTYYQMIGWDVQGFDNFEDDGAYAVQQFKAWAPRFIKVDPFVQDSFPGDMTP